jgi:hypothetical protein
MRIRRLPLSRPERKVSLGKSPRRYARGRARRGLRSERVTGLMGVRPDDTVQLVGEQVGEQAGEQVGEQVGE